MHYQNQSFSSDKLQALLLSFKVQKIRDDSWFYCKQVQEMPVCTLREAVLYQGQGNLGEVLPRLRYTE